MLSLMYPCDESGTFSSSGGAVPAHFAVESTQPVSISALNSSASSPVKVPLAPPLLTSTPLSRGLAQPARLLQRHDVLPAGVECFQQRVVEEEEVSDYVQPSLPEECASQVPAESDLASSSCAPADPADSESSRSTVVEICHRPQPEEPAAAAAAAASVANGGSTAFVRNGKLKRVSFGSSKGSMVETLVYDCDSVVPLREEEHEDGGGLRPAPAASGSKLPDPQTEQQDGAGASSSYSGGATSRLRVTYYDSGRPLLVTDHVTDHVTDLAPADCCAEVCERSTRVPAGSAHLSQDCGGQLATTLVHDMPTTYIVQKVESGWENPFRPGGELSVEAEHIVRAIKSGQSLAHSNKFADPAVANGTPADQQQQQGATDVLDGTSPTASSHSGPTAPPVVANGAEGCIPPSGGGHSPPDTAGSQVQPLLSTVPVEQPSRPEQVCLSKQRRAKCCVVQ